MYPVTVDDGSNMDIHFSNGEATDEHFVQKRAVCPNCLDPNPNTARRVQSQNQDQERHGNPLKTNKDNSAMESIGFNSVLFLCDKNTFTCGQM